MGEGTHHAFEWEWDLGRERGSPEVAWGGADTVWSRLAISRSSTGIEGVRHNWVGAGQEKGCVTGSGAFLWALHLGIWGTHTRLPAQYTLRVEKKSYSCNLEMIFFCKCSSILVNKLFTFDFTVKICRLQPFTKNSLKIFYVILEISRNKMQSTP